MGNTPKKRPSHARRVTKATEKKRHDVMDEGMALTIDDERFVVRLGDITPALARELRATIGHGFSWLVNAIPEEPDTDLIAAFVWLARRIRGEDVALEEIHVDYGQIFSDGFIVERAVAETDEELDSPEG